MYQTVIKFWFEELGPSSWWKKSEEIDRIIRCRFFELHQLAARCELFDWRNTPEGRLAEIILLDQFSRNMFRDTRDAFSFDGLALALSQEAVASGADTSLNNIQRNFLYLPHMHSESKIVHRIAVELYSQPGLEYNLDFELRHKAIIDRFGRYPHRNSILGRVSTAEEIEFLKQPDSGF